MNRGYDLTITISSYNRDDKVLETLRRLFAADFGEFSRLEVIVVDDGSPRPVENLLPALGPVPEKIDFRLIRQENSGIGATRNRGFRAAQSRIVLFLDDDILLAPDTIGKIYRAQREHGGAVVFGSYPFVSHESRSLEKFARRLFGYDEITADARFEQVNAITSGLLCVDKSKLDDPDKFYRDDLTVPAAEEYEIVFRFHRLGLPIVHARHIHAVHNHHLELEWLVGQQFKYGLGTAEAFAKYPEIVALENFDELKRKLDALGKGSLRNASKAALATEAGRRGLLHLARALQRAFPSRDHDFVYGLLTSAYYWAGYKSGVVKFSRN